MKTTEQVDVYVCGMSGSRARPLSGAVGFDDLLRVLEYCGVIGEEEMGSLDTDGQIHMASISALDPVTAAADKAGRTTGVTVAEFIERLADERDKATMARDKHAVEIEAARIDTARAVKERDQLVEEIKALNNTLGWWKADHGRIERWAKDLCKRLTDANGAASATMDVYERIMSAARLYGIRERETMADFLKRMVGR